MWWAKNTETSRVDVIEDKILEGAGVWYFPNPRVAGGRKGYPEAVAL